MSGPLFDLSEGSTVPLPAALGRQCDHPTLPASNPAPATSDSAPSHTNLLNHLIRFCNFSLARLAARLDLSADQLTAFIDDPQVNARLQRFRRFNARLGLIHTHESRLTALESLEHVATTHTDPTERRRAATAILFQRTRKVPSPSSSSSSSPELTLIPTYQRPSFNLTPIERRWPGSPSRAARASSCDFLPEKPSAPQPDDDLARAEQEEIDELNADPASQDPFEEADEHAAETQAEDLAATEADETDEQSEEHGDNEDLDDAEPTSLATAPTHSPPPRLHYPSSGRLIFNEDQEEKLGLELRESLDRALPLLKKLANPNSPDAQHHADTLFDLLTPDSQNLWRTHAQSISPDTSHRELFRRSLNPDILKLIASAASIMLDFVEPADRTLIAKHQTSASAFLTLYPSHPWRHDTPPSAQIPLSFHRLTPTSPWRLTNIPAFPNPDTS